MDLRKNQIVDVLYNSPWLINEKYTLSNIIGSNEEKSKDILVGREELNKSIDILLKDIDENRPVIVYIKSEDILIEDIAYMLEFKTLLISMSDKYKFVWKKEFGERYYIPKLMIIGKDISEEVRISANLSCIDVRILEKTKKINVVEKENKAIDSDISDFKSSNDLILIEDRSEWVEEMFEWTLKVIREYGNEDIKTINSLYKTSANDSWIQDLHFPFINIPFEYREDSLGGLYEFDDDLTQLSKQSIYFDFLIQRIYYAAENENIEDMEIKSKHLFEQKHYDILNYEDGIVTVKVDRSILNSYKDFRDTLFQLLSDSVYINKEMFRRFGELK